MTPGGLAPPSGGVDRNAPAGCGRRCLPMSGLHVRQFGEEGAPAIVCLHGVTSWGGHFEALAALLAPAYRVARARPARPRRLGAGSLRGGSPTTSTHLSAALGRRRARIWLGHSFGGRLAFEWAASRPGAVDRLVLLDPAILVPPPVALWAAEHARVERRYPSFEEAIDRRYEESQLHRAPRALVEDELRHHLVEEPDGWRYRYSQAAVVAAYGEMASSPPPFERSASRPSSCSASSRTCRTTICSTRTERRSATCSRSSRCPAATRCSGMRSTRPPPRSRASSLAAVDRRRLAALTYTVGYLVGSLASDSINRTLSDGADPTRAARADARRDPDRDLPLYSRDYDADFPPAGRRSRRRSPQSTPCCSSRPSTTAASRAH